MTNSIAELEYSGCILVIGSNTTATHPLVATRIQRAVSKGANLVVADPRNIQLALDADVHIRHRLGTDVALINGLMHVILERGWHDQAFIQERTENFQDLKKAIEDYPPERVCDITGAFTEDIVRAAELYATAKTGSIVYCMGITQHITGVDNVKSLANLAMLCGHVGKEFSGVNPLRGQNNVQGACDMGALPDMYPGYQPTIKAENRKKFEKAWNSPLPDAAGLALPDMLAGLAGGSVKALYIAGENPMVSEPDVSSVKQALKAAELLVVQDIFFTPTAELAHVVLPAVSFAEKDGTFTNTERRVQRIRQAVEPEGEALADWIIIQRLSERMGFFMNYESPEKIMNEIAALTPAYGGVTYARLVNGGLQWPCSDIDHPGTKFLYKNAFARGKGRFHAVSYKPPAETVDPDYPLWLTTGRLHVHYHSGTMTRNSPALNTEMPEVIVEIHPDDASKISIREGDTVTIRSRRGRVAAKALVTRRVPPGVVFMPFHFAENCANLLTNPAHDPVAKTPEYKVCAVMLQKGTRQSR